ncbi:tRNA (adenosine(37)-N6)-threonylcarbamoyltransferase complex ATPase subunit type 1 TsaE [Maritalea sp.]|uniref:tRNA (adenosine(37)-N6)-threonylcarbamoyltransferase complex ATPase subunit type 1 TsaE n=1 Tax=Maritalea sp. TaxID=2003361 RepID=UPI003EF224B0
MADRALYKILTEIGTIQLASAFAELVKPGDIILLNGDLGAGKSFFARSLLRVLANDPELEVPSPTFSLVQPYQFQSINCIHADLYRLSDESEAEELGLFDGDNLLLIEWPDRLPELAAKARFSLTLSNIKGEMETRKLLVEAESSDLNKLAALLESRSDINLSSASTS